jgi:hypothetical protein
MQLSRCFPLVRAYQSCRSVVTEDGEPPKGWREPQRGMTRNGNGVYNGDISADTALRSRRLGRTHGRHGPARDSRRQGDAEGLARATEAGPFPLRGGHQGRTSTLPRALAIGCTGLETPSSKDSPGARAAGQHPFRTKRGQAAHWPREGGAPLLPGTTRQLRDRRTDQHRRPNRPPLGPSIDPKSRPGEVTPLSSAEANDWVGAPRASSPIPPEPALRARRGSAHSGSLPHGTKGQGCSRRPRERSGISPAGRRTLDPAPQSRIP